MNKLIILTQYRDSLKVMQDKFNTLEEETVNGWFMFNRDNYTTEQLEFALYKSMDKSERGLSVAFVVFDNLASIHILNNETKVAQVRPFDFTDSLADLSKFLEDAEQDLSYAEIIAEALRRVTREGWFK